MFEGVGCGSVEAGAIVFVRVYPGSEFTVPQLQLLWRGEEHWKGSFPGYTQLGCRGAGDEEVVEGFFGCVAVAAEAKGGGLVLVFREVRQSRAGWISTDGVFELPVAQSSIHRFPPLGGVFAAVGWQRGIFVEVDAVEDVGASADGLVDVVFRCCVGESLRWAGNGVCDGVGAGIVCVVGGDEFE